MTRLNDEGVVERNVFIRRSGAAVTLPVRLTSEMPGLWLLRPFAWLTHRAEPNGIRS